MYTCCTLTPSQYSDSPDSQVHDELPGWTAKAETMHDKCELPDNMNERDGIRSHDAAPESSTGAIMAPR